VPGLPPVSLPTADEPAPLHALKPTAIVRTHTFSPLVPTGALDERFMLL